jgi:hypothetical protein
MDLEVIYSAALERQYIQSQQKTAPPLAATVTYRTVIGPRRIRSASLRQTVLRYLRARPGEYFSSVEIGHGIDEEYRRAAYTLGDLVQEGFVKKFYTDRRGRGPQRYAAR